MLSPPDNSSAARRSLFASLLILCLMLSVLSLSGCGGKLIKSTSAEPKSSSPPPPPPPPTVSTWLGNSSRNFYGTGPWAAQPAEVLWEFETGLISGPLHKLGWGGSSWPGQPSVVGKRVYFGSAD